MVITDVPDIGITLGEKLFVAVSGVTTVRVSDAAEPVPALAVDIVPVLLV
jgi:hypothetical protein